MKHTEFYRLRLKDRWFTEFYYLSPTDDTDLIDFLPFFHLRFKDRWFGFNDSLLDYVKIALQMTQMPCGVLHQTDINHT